MPVLKCAWTTQKKRKKARFLYLFITDSNFVTADNQLVLTPFFVTVLAHNEPCTRPYHSLLHGRKEEGRRHRQRSQEGLWPQSRPAYDFQLILRVKWHIFSCSLQVSYQHHSSNSLTKPSLPLSKIDILNVVKESCQEAFNLPSFDTTLQTIKSHFFDRNYDAVFQNPEHLPVYSARYAPSRALCYFHMFMEHPVLMKTLEGPSKILCIGSGAGSELVGISAAMVHANPVVKVKKAKKASTKAGKGEAEEMTKDDDSKESKDTNDAEEDSTTTTLGMENLAVSTEATQDPASPTATSEMSPAPTTTKTKTKKSKVNKHQVTIVMQDYVDWSRILEPMEAVVRSRMVLGPERLQCETEVGNVLDLSEGLLERVAKADLITFMFVLNELFQDKKRTMLLVAKIVAAMPSGAHMLVS